MLLLGSRSIPAEGCIDIGLINEALLIVSCFYRDSAESCVCSIKAAIFLDCFVSFFGDHSMCPVVINGRSCVRVIIENSVGKLWYVVATIAFTSYKEAVALVFREPLKPVDEESICICCGAPVTSVIVI